MKKFCRARNTFAKKHSFQCKAFEKGRLFQIWTVFLLSSIPVFLVDGRFRWNRCTRMQVWRSLIYGSRSVCNRVKWNGTGSKDGNWIFRGYDGARSWDPARKCTPASLYTLHKMVSRPISTPETGFVLFSLLSNVHGPFVTRSRWARSSRLRNSYAYETKRNRRKFHVRISLGCLKPNNWFLDCSRVYGSTGKPRIKGKKKEKKERKKRTILREGLYAVGIFPFRISMLTDWFDLCI